MLVREISCGTEDYQRERRLREEILRSPLGLSLRDEDLAGEEKQWHFGLFEPNGELLACVLAVPLAPTEARIRQMAVSSAHQGKGLGRRLLREVEGKLRTRGVRRLELSARTSAAGFYEKLGYGAVGGEYVSHTIPHVRMVKDL